MNRWLSALSVLLALMLPTAQVAAKDSQHGPWTDASLTKAAGDAFVQFVGDREHISVIEFSGNYDRDQAGGGFNLAPRVQIAQEFYAHHADHYDFLIVFSTFEFATGEATAFHFGVQNPVQGIGLPLYDDTALFGSNGRLQGFIDMAAMARYPLDRLQPDFDQVLGILAHEVMHQWGVRVRFRDSAGTASDALLGQGGAHWSFLFDSDASLMYGNDWTLNGDGSFTSGAVRRFFHPLDLYLAGFYDIDEVPPFTLLSNPAIDPARLPEQGATITGTPQTLTIDDILAVEGVRIPAAEEAQKQFRSAFILLTRPGEQISDEQLRSLNDVRKELPTRFAILSGGRAVMEVYPQALSDAQTGTVTPLAGDGIRPGDSSVADALAWLRAQQHDDGYWQDLEHTRTRDTAAALITLSRIDDAFDNAAGAIGWLNTHDSGNLDYLARTLQALNAVDADTGTRYAQLIGRQNSDGGWGLGRGYASNPWDTTQALSALTESTDDYHSVIQAAGAYLQISQNSDGGWSSVASGPGRVALTATVLEALAAADAAEPVLTTAIDWLAAYQQADGGFGDTDSNVLDTARVLRALTDLNAVERIDSAPAIDYLRSRQSVSGSWGGSVYSTAQVALLLKQFAFPNWSVARPLTITPAQPRDGERVGIGISVSNDGGNLTPAGTLRLYDAPPEQGGQAVGEDLTIPILGPRQTVTFQPLWDSLNQAGERTLVAIVDPDNAVIELSEQDNHAEVSFTVQAAPSAAELELRDSDVIVTPGQPQTLPADLAISATLRNLGLSDADNVRVVLWQGAPGSGAIVAEQTVSIAARSTLAVNFTHTLTAAGSSLFTLEADADNHLAEADETNNRAEVTVATQASIDLAIKDDDISLIGGSVHLGSDATFRVQIHNNGTLDAPPTQVRYRLGNGIETRELALNTIQPGAGETLTQTIVWRADLTGELTFSADIDPANQTAETDETNNHATLSFSAGAIEQINLVIDHRELNFAPEPALEGQPLTITAQIRNTGGSDASDVQVGFYQFEVAPEHLLGVQSIAQLAAGAAATISLEVLQVQGQETRLIQVVADPADLLAEFSEDDNRAFRTLPVRGLADLTLSSGSLELAPRFPSPGQTVTLTATVANLGGQSAQDIVVQVFDGDPEQNGIAVVADQLIEHIDAHSEGQVSFTWQYSDAGGARPIVVRVDPDNVIPEADIENNKAQLFVAVQDADAFVSERYFSPDGDGVQDTTQLFFRLDQAADATIEIRDRREQIVRRYRSADLNNVSEGYFEWGGLDDRGTLVADGDYRLQVVDSSGHILAEAVATLDTNRSSLLEAAGTPFELTTNLTCLLPDIDDLQLTDNEEHLLFFIESADQPDPVFVDGIYRMAAGGGEITPLISAAAHDNANLVQLEMTANGARLAYRSDDQRLWIAEGDGSVWEYASLALAADSEILGFRDTDTLIVRSDRTIWKLILDNGFTQPQALYNASYGIDRFAFSPDKSRLVLRDIAGYGFPGPGTLMLLDLTDNTTRSLLDIDSFFGEGPHFTDLLDARPDFAWSPDGTLLAITDVVNRMFMLTDPHGDIRQTYPLPEASPPFDIPAATDSEAGELLQPVLREISAPQWTGNGSELVLTLSYHDGREARGGGDKSAVSKRFIKESEEEESNGQGSHFAYQRIVLFNRLNGEFSTVAWSEPGDPTQPWTADPALAGQGLLAPFGSALWGPNERILIYAATQRGAGARLVNGEQRSIVPIAIRLDENNRPQALFEDFSDFQPDRFSPGGRSLLFRSRRDRNNPLSPCFERAATDTFVFRSLANLTVDLRPRRSSTLGGVLLEGTAADVHFAGYRIEYASIGNPGNWQPVMPVSTQPVIDDRFTTWVPPGPGTYLIRLSVSDLAGNQRRAIKRISWSDSPSITDLYREPAYLSPNGDGIQDQAAIHYKVLEPVHLVFQFFDDDGDQIRVIERSHDQIGVEHELLWDGRDQSGAVVADGKYRLAVQNFEFFIHIDNTPPQTEISLQQALQTAYDDLVDYQVITVAPGLTASVRERNLDSTSLETGTGANPFTWTEFAGVALQPVAGDEQRYETEQNLSIDQFTNRRFRLRATDLAGNTTLATTELGPEQLILHRFEGIRVPVDSNDDVFTLLAGTQNIELGISETIRAQTLQLFVQYRPSSQTNWFEAGLTQFVENQDGTIPNGHPDAIWDLSDIDAGAVYQSRLRLVTANGDYFSNVVQFEIDAQEENIWLLGEFDPAGNIPNVNLPVALDRVHYDLLQQASAAGNFDRSNLFVWAVDNISAAFDEIRLNVRSLDDPRYFIPVALTPIVATEDGLLFELPDPAPCSHYFGALEVSTVVDDTGHVNYYTGEELSFGLDCLNVAGVVVAPEFTACEEAAGSDIRFIELTAESLDGTELVLLTLSRQLPDGGEDLLYSRSQPLSGQNYTVELDLQDLPEQRHTFLARIANGEGKQAVSRINVIVDRTPPLLTFTYPQQNDRLCGVTREIAGQTRSVLDFEGSIEDDGGFFYRVDIDTPLTTGFTPLVFERAEQNNAPILPLCYGSGDEDKDALFASAGRHGEPYPGNQCQEIFGPLTTYGDAPDADESKFTGPATARLHVYDRGGFHACTDVTFFYDGAVEGAEVNPVTTLFSPNGDGRLDVLELIVSSDEVTTIDSAVYATVMDSANQREIDGPILHGLANDVQLLSEETLRWDGRNTDDRIVDDGVYGIVTTFRDACGHTIRHTVFVTVDNTPPEAAISYPLPGDPLALIIEVQGSIHDQHIDYYQLDFGEGNNPLNWILLDQGTRNITEQIIGSWDTFGLNGVFTLRLNAIDKAENITEARVPLTFDTPVQLITGLQASARIFSPNGDDRLDTSRIHFVLAADAIVDLDIRNESGSIVRQLLTGGNFAQGSASAVWDGLADQGVSLPDGVYTVRLRAQLSANPAVSEQADISLIIDNSAPDVVLDSPAGDYASPDTAILGSINDPHIAHYQLAITATPDAPVWTDIDSGEDNRIGHYFGNLASYQQGQYALRLSARDAADNYAERIVRFTLDATPPQVTIINPAMDRLLSAANGPHLINAGIVEEYLTEYRLELSPASTPDQWTTLLASSDMPANAVAYAWDVSSLADSVYQLRLLATDRAGQTGLSQISVTIDNTPPEAVLDTPQESDYISAPVLITGSVSDAHFSGYQLAIAPGDKTTASQWSPLGQGNQVITGATLLDWQALPPDGLYTLQLSAQDQAANAISRLIELTVDTTPPAAPVGLGVARENGRDVRISWEANGEPDLAGYRVYRDGVPISSELIDDTGYLDADVADGPHGYSVTAVDRAGLESAPSMTVDIVIDTTPPATSIYVPTDNGRIGGLVDIKGTAHSLDDFKEYRLYLQAENANGARQLLRRSAVPVRNDLLAQWDTLPLAQDGRYLLRLESEDISGNTGAFEIHVSIDNQPPSAPTGVSATVTDNNVALQWNDNPESDLLGYLIFRDGELVNASGVVVGELTPYVITAPAYTDGDRPDGVISYEIHAIDQAGNLSPPSQPVSVELDTRPPQATLIAPEDGEKFEQPLFLKAVTPDNDIARVQFQYQADNTPGWIDIGPADMAPPWEASWNPDGLSYGDYLLRAVATDHSGLSDPAAPAITVTYIDLDRPQAVQDLTAHVDGDKVYLSWQTIIDEDLAGYYIERRDSNNGFIRITDHPLVATDYTDNGLADAIYDYRVIAVDQFDNEADASTAVRAEVYTPQLIQPYTPIQELNTALAGSGAANAQVTITLDEGTGQAGIFTGISDSLGDFFLEAIVLPRGNNVLTARFTDINGNTSKPASVPVVSAAVPAAPAGLTASLSDPATVELNWAANTEPDILGYRPFRNGQALLPDTLASGLTASASSQWSSSYHAGRSVDNSSSTYWSPQNDSGNSLAGQWLQIDLSDAAIVTEFELFWGEIGADRYAAADYDVQAWDGSVWVTLAQLRDNTESYNVIALEKPYRSTRLRLLLLRGLQPATVNRSLRLTELKIKQRPYLTEQTYQETVGDGHYGYTVTALNQYGFESLSSDTASVASGDTQAPEPVTLSAQVSGSDVVLNWTASSSEDVIRYDLYRNDDKIAEQYELTLLNYTDIGRPDGSYRYYVTGVDTIGNVSLPSNEITVTVARDPLDGPLNLSVEPVPQGGALDLSWQTGGSDITRYEIQRAGMSGGPYQTVTTTSATRYRDSGLDNGVTYYYVIVGIDSAGNQSAPSSEAAGTPADSVAPSEPVLHAPGFAGLDYVTSATRTAITGTAEPDVLVDLYRDNLWLGDTRATLNIAIDSTSLYGWYGLSLSPDGRYLLANRYSTASVYDYQTGSEHSLPGYLIATRWITPTELIYSDNYAIRRYEPVSQQIASLAAADYIWAMVPTSGSEHIIVLARRDGNQGWYLFTANDASWTFIAPEANPWSIAPNSLIWSADESVLVYRRSTDELELLDPDSGEITVIDDVVPSAAHWSPAGTAFTYLRHLNGVIHLKRYQLEDGSTDTLSEVPDITVAAQWSADGRSIVLLQQTGDLLQYDLVSGELNTLYTAAELDLQNLNLPSLQWLKSGYLAILDTRQQHRLTLPGHFNFPSIRLNDGNNRFSAIAEDNAGQRSGRSQAMEIRVAVEQRSDLTIKAHELVVLPAIAQTGARVRASATVRNIGKQTASAPTVSLVVQGPNGFRTTLAHNALLPMLAAGTASTISRDFVIPNDFGTYTFVAVADPDNSLAEISETNNYAQHLLTVTADAKPAMSIELARRVYLNHQDVIASVAIVNPGDPFAGDLHLTIEDSEGFEVARLDTPDAIELLFNERLTEPAHWNTADIFAGSYHLRATLENSARSWQQTVTADFAIAEVIELQTSLNTGQINYSPGEIVTMMATVDYVDGNVALTDAIGRFAIYDENDRKVTELTVPINGLLPGGRRELLQNWDDVTAPPGRYRLHFDVEYEERILASSETLFERLEQVIQFSGTLFLSDPQPALGDLLQIDYGIENNGNTIFTQLPAVIRLYDGTQGKRLTEKSLTVDLAPGAEYNGSTHFATGDLEVKNYLIALSVQLPTEEITLQVDNFTPQDLLPPNVTITVPQDDAFMDSDLSVRVTADDLHSAIRQTEVSVNNGPWMVLDLIDADDGFYSGQLSFLDDGTYQLRARALDQWDNAGETALRRFQVDRTPPVISISGISDGEQYTAAVTPVIAIDEANPATRTITLNNAPFTSGTPVTEESDYTLLVTAHDSAGNQAQRRIDFSLHFDETLTPPVMTISDVSIIEGSSDVTTTHFTLQLSKTAEQPVRVAYITESVSALAGEDFIFHTGTVELAPGVVSAQIAVDIIADDIVENDETFRLRLYDPQSVTLARDQAIATIRNDDPASNPQNPPEDDPTDSTDDDADDTPTLPAQPALRVTLKDSLLIDTLDDQQAGPDDTVRYTLSITNTGNTDLTGLHYEATVPEHTRSGSASEDDGTIVRMFNTLEPGRTAVFRYDVLIDQTIPADVLYISHQGRVYSDQSAVTSSDDPDTPQNGDATLTPLFHLVDIPTLGTWMLLILGFSLIIVGYMSTPRFR